jgi:hypothetical protein
MVQADLGKKQDPVSKTTRTKMAGGVAQEVEWLLSKCKNLVSSKDKNKKQKTKQLQQTLIGLFLSC